MTLPQVCLSYTTNLSCIIPNVYPTDLTTDFTGFTCLIARFFEFSFYKFMKFIRCINSRTQKNVELFYQNNNKTVFFFQLVFERIVRRLRKVTWPRKRICLRALLGLEQENLHRPILISPILRKDFSLLRVDITFACKSAGQHAW